MPYVQFPIGDYASRLAERQEWRKIALGAAVAIVAIIVLCWIAFPLVQPPFVGVWRQDSSPAWFMRHDRDGNVPAIADSLLVIEPGPESGKGSLTCTLVGPDVAGFPGGTQQEAVGWTNRVYIPFKWERSAMYGSRSLIHFQPDFARSRVPASMHSRVPERFGYDWLVDGEGRHMTLSYRYWDSPQTESVGFERISDGPQHGNGPGDTSKR